MLGVVFGGATELDMPEGFAFGHRRSSRRAGVSLVTIVEALGNMERALASRA